MASSIFISAQGGWNFDGTTVNVSNPLSVTGLITTSGGLTTTSSGDITVSSSRFISWSARGSLNSPADSQVNFTNFAGTSGVGWDVSTDAVAKLRTRAQSAYATLDCLGLKASGTAGASFGPAGIVSITIVNGIVTAAS